MTEPLVSVVMPAYRCAGTICAAVDSALRQNVPLEVIVVEDASDDDISGALAAYREDPRVVYLTNDENLGAAESRNRGVAAARGEYVAFLDADDLWRPGKLEAQLAALEATGAVLCATARELMRPDGTLTGHIIPVKQTITYRELLKHNSISCSSVLLKTETARAFPLHHADSHEDYILWLEILQKHGFACGVNEPFLIYRASSTGKSGSKLRSAAMTFRVYRYMGFGPVKSCVCFFSYAVHGIRKHWLAGRKRP